MSAVPIPALVHCSNCDGLREVNRFGQCVVCGSESVHHGGPSALDLAKQRREREAAETDRARFLRRGRPCDCGGCAPVTGEEDEGR